MRTFSRCLCIAVCGLLASPSVTAFSTAVEYYYAGYGHYFVTALPAEIAALDSGRFPGWVRTGESFGVFDLGTTGAANVCRFWSGQTFAPKSSHFYTPFAFECAYLKQQGVWQYEGDAFALVLPDATGNCGSGSVPLYRLYNNGQTGAPNHRFTTSLATRATMLAQGWIAEGSGIGVMGCVLPGPPASVTVDSPTSSPWVGESVLLTATARDASGAAIPGTTATWSSSNPVVATISATGVVQGVAPGSVAVTATIDGVSGTQTLTVTPMPKIGVSVSTTKEVVVRWATDRCSDLDTPDQPAHLVRAEDGSLVLIDGDAPRNYVSRGADFSSLKRDCSQPVLVSADRPIAESYENQEWLWVVYRQGSRWHALIHNEFHDPIASTCRPGDTAPGNPCWYNSITYAVSMDGARSFAKPSPPAHVVAPPPNIWVPPLPGDTSPGGFYFAEGYRTPTNVVRANDGYYYALMLAFPSKYSEARGLCAIRTNVLDDPASWRAWDGQGFNLRMTSPYVTGTPAPSCTFLNLPMDEMGTVVYDTYLGRYALVVTGQWPACGFYFSLSADLIHWSTSQLLVEAHLPWCRANPQSEAVLEPVTVLYPSIIDHADATINFESAGRTPHLYYVRFNDGGLDRDLVRVPLTFTRSD